MNLEIKYVTAGRRSERPTPYLKVKINSKDEGSTKTNGVRVKLGFTGVVQVGTSVRRMIKSS